MKTLALVVVVSTMGCSSLTNPPADPPFIKRVEERGPHGSWPHKIEVTTSDPGAKIEVNKAYIGDAPLTITVYGDHDGTFRRGMDYIIRAYPVKPGQYLQTKTFSGGGRLGPEERVPQRIFFDLNLPAPDKEQVDVNGTTKDDPKPK